MSEDSKIVVTVLAYDITGIEGGTEYTMVFSPGVSTKIKGPFRMNIAGILGQILEEYGIQVLSIEQASEDGCFAMILIGDMGDNIVNLEHLRTILAERGKQVGASIKIQKADLFRYMHRI
ncbi:MAG: hypothetical protein J7M18_03335 [Candidatus Eremiobacteraeota bacterium]|nr:hypothetical protein [Candidatus Eremiobacteraeota bacterium]